MATIEGFRVQNFRSLRDVSLGKLSGEQVGKPLTPFTVVIGKNGVGKSTLFDAFGFVADCLATDVETACDMKQRGGFDRMRSKGVTEPIRFEIYYREAQNERPITYELAIDLDADGRPFVLSEALRQQGIGRIPKNLNAGGDPAKRILLDQLPKLLGGYGKTPGIDAVVVVGATQHLQPRTLRGLDLGLALTRTEDAS